MNQLFLLLTFFMFITCAQTPPAEKIEVIIHPGEVRWIEFPVKTSEAKWSCRGKEMRFEHQGNKGRAIVVESYFSNKEPFSCLVEENGVVTAHFAFQVNERTYPAEQLRVDSKKIQLSPEALKRVQREQEVLNRIYASSEGRFLFITPFKQPLNSHVTSIYGTRRLYNKKKKGQHLGIDYRASIGDRVPAANRGKVVFAGDLFYTGETVILDHGLDIFTVYGHLSKTLVKAGEIVEQGTLIGLSGNTGRTSGPHLHWGVKIQGEYIDGMDLIDQTQKFLTQTKVP